MNDPFEDRLRALRPGSLPPDLATRLDRPPAASVTPMRSTAVRLLGTAAAAAALVLVARHTLQRPAGPVIAGPTSLIPAPAVAGQRSTEITGVRPVAVITDESNHPWKLVEVNWVEEDTYVFSARPAAVRTQERFHTVVPVAVRFD